MKYFLFSLVLIFGCQNPFQNEQSLSDLVWISVASGEAQCMPPDYSTLEEAIFQLKDNGIIVYSSKQFNNPVCLACGCPTGISYQAFISSNQFSVAQNLGWEVVDESQNFD